MTTWAQFLADVRVDLKDTDPQKTSWSDGELYLWTKDALSDYSQHFPLRVDRSQLTLTGASYPLPADFIRDVFVECPQDRYLERRNARPGVKYRTRNTRPTQYYIDGSNLTLNGSPGAGEEVLLSYYAFHPTPADENDSAFAFTVRNADIELLRLYVKAKAYQQLRSRTSKADRYKYGGSRRDDNPIEPEVDDILQEYLTRVAQRYQGGTIHLHRPGRAR